MTRKCPVVAIDGPAGAGKSTVTRRVADALGYSVVDTGALYRAVALAAARRGIGFDDVPGVGALARELAERGAIRFDSNPSRVLLDGDDVSAAIRSAEISQGASKVSAMPAVRDSLLSLQRQAGANGAVVLEGRDIGSVVFPDAEAKFFLTASLQVRAERRHRELLERGQPAALSDVEREVVERDRRDSTRPVAPLVRAPDAELIDSSASSVEQVVDAIVTRVREIQARLDAE